MSKPYHIIATKAENDYSITISENPNVSKIIAGIKKAAGVYACRLKYTIKSSL